MNKSIWNGCPTWKATIPASGTILRKKNKEDNKTTIMGD